MLITFLTNQSSSTADLRVFFETHGHQVECVDPSNESELLAHFFVRRPDRVLEVGSASEGARAVKLAEACGIESIGSGSVGRDRISDGAYLRLEAEALGFFVSSWSSVSSHDDFDPKGLRLPLRVRNGTGRSVVVRDPQSLSSSIRSLLEGSEVIVEEIVEGSRILFVWVERKLPGIEALPPVTLGPTDELLDNASIDPRPQVERLARALGLRGAAVFTMVVDAFGAVWLESVDPSVDLTSSSLLFRVAERNGVSARNLLEAILGPGKKSKKSVKGLRFGFTYNLRRISNKDSDKEAEFDSPETIASIHRAIASFGHEVIDLEATKELPMRLSAAQVDIVFNIAEGSLGRSREAQVPALLEMLDIPYTGSDPLTLSLALDKALAKRVVESAGLRTSPFVTMRTGKEKLPPGFSFPAIAKPVAEGSSRGIVGKCVAESESELREMVPEIVGRYGQAVLVESFLPGREFTIGLLGDPKPNVLPILEVIFTKPEEKFPVYSFESKFHGLDNVRFEVPAKLDDELERELVKIAKGCFHALGCRDFARIDFRLDAEGRPAFIEANPLPGLSPGFSDFCVIAQAAGLDHTALIGEIIAPAIRRLRSRRRA